MEYLSDKHHFAYPKSAYVEPLEKRFRCLPVLIHTDTPRPNHELLHILNPPTKKLPMYIMQEVIEMQTCNLDYVISELDLHRNGAARRFADRLMDQLEIIYMPVEQAVYELNLRRSA